MWDDHWCKTMAQEGNFLALRINNFAQKFRSLGGTVIHVPYLRSNGKSIGEKNFVASYFLKFKKFRGCKCCGLVCQKLKDKPVWSQIHPALRVKKTDYIMTKLDDLLRVKNIHNYFIVGQHVNECILERPIGGFALKLLKKNFCIIKDLTNDSFRYDCPEDIKNEFFDCVEKFVCPLINNDELIAYIGNV